MSYNNGKITLPIDVSDPYYVLGVGSLNGKIYSCTNFSK